MKVLHVVYNSHPDVTGAAVRTRYLVETQARMGVRPVVLSSPFQPPAEPAQSRGVEYWNDVAYHRCYNGHDPARFMAADKPWWERAAKLAALGGFVFRVRQVALEEKVDVIHAHNLFFCGLAAAAAGRSLRLPVIYEIRSLIEQGVENPGRFLPWAYRRLDGLACRLASHVTVLCRGLAEEMMRRGVPAYKITVAGNGVDPEAHSPQPERSRAVVGQLGFPPDAFVAGYIGTVVPYEGLDLLIDAAVLRAPGCPRLRLLIVGDGSARPALERQARRRGLEQMVRFVGRVGHDQVSRFYDAIDLFVLPRRSGGLADRVTPLKPLEIMAHGKPLLASDCGGHRELIVDGVNGALFRAFYPAVLARRIEEMMADPQELERLGRSARQWVREHRTWESQCRPVVQLYESLAAVKRAERRGVLLVAPAPSPVPTGGVENGAGMILRSPLAPRHRIRIWDRARPGGPRRRWAARLARQLFHFARFAACLAIRRPRVVHIKSSSGVNFVESALYAWISRLLLRRTLLQLHSGDFERWYGAQTRAGRWAIRRALGVPSGILVLSERWRDLMARLVPGRPIHVVPNGVEIPDAPPVRPSSHGTLRVLTIATLGSHKGHFEILAAAARLKGRPIRFLLAGPNETSGRGEGERVRRRAAELGLEDNVEFLGPVGAREKWDLLAGADVFLLPSRTEAMPNAVLEAMAAGLPVVATPVGSLPEMLGEGSGGCFVAPGDSEALAETLIELLESPSRRAEMGRWNRARAESRYRFEGVMQQLEALYREPPAGAARAAGRRLRAPALFLLVAELAARLLAPAPPQWLWPQTQFEASSSLGFRPRPNQTSYTADQPFRTNSLGLRGAELSVAKPAGVRRVLILGDSIASGYGVTEEDSFARRLERLLDCQVINAGVPSYNTAQEVEYLARYGLAFEPDVVVLALYWNDIHDKAGIGVDAEGRLVETRPGGPSGPPHSPAAYRLRNLLKGSRLAYLALDRWRALSLAVRPPLQRETQMAVLEGTHHQRVEQGWQAIETQLARLAALSRAHRFQPLVLILPMPQQLGRRFPRVRYQGVVRAMCQRHGLPWLDLEPAFRQASARGVSLFLPYDGDHTNANGHALIADQLWAALRAQPRCPASREAHGPIWP